MKKYILKALKEFKLKEANGVRTPITPSVELKPGGENIFNKETYMKFFGKLTWIQKVRPEVSFTVNCLCRVAKASNKDAWHIRKRCFRYLKQSIDFKI